MAVDLGRGVLKIGKLVKGVEKKFKKGVVGMPTLTWMNPFSSHKRQP